MWESFVHHTKGVDVILFVLMKSNALRGCGLFQLSQTLKEREKSISVTWMTPVTTPCLTVLFEFIWAGRQVWSSVGGGCIGQERNKKGLPGFRVQLGEVMPFIATFFIVVPGGTEHPVNIPIPKSWADSAFKNIGVKESYSKPMTL